jgi:hypothetical protein
MSKHHYVEDEADEIELPRVRRAIEPDGSADVIWTLAQRYIGGSRGGGDDNREEANNEYVYMTSTQLSLMQP